MKKEVLRVSHLSMEDTSSNQLKDISFCAFQGDRIGFCGLADSGKDLLVHLLTGSLDIPVRGFGIYADGKKIKMIGELNDPVYCLRTSQYRVTGSWTVAEYIGMEEKGWLLTNARKREMVRETDACFMEMGLEFDSARKMSELTELERRIADLVKARRQNKKLLIIEDEFEGMDPDDIRYFGQILKELTRNSMAVLVNSYSDIVLRELTDFYLIFRKGEIVKKCRNAQIRSREHMERFMLRGSSRAVEEAVERYAENDISRGRTAFSVNAADRRGERIDLTFRKGEVTTLIISDRERKEEFFRAVSGREKRRSLYCIDGTGIILSGGMEMFLKNRIASICQLGSRTELFSHMSVEENLILPSLPKISAAEYILSGGRMEKMLRDSAQQQMNLRPGKIRELGLNELITLTLERWYILKPNVLILLEPYLQCDIYGAAIVDSYIRKFAARGTAVIIVKSRDEYVQEISDHMIRIDNILI